MKKLMHKLVRDKIPMIVQDPARFRVATKSEYKMILVMKLLEEAQEFFETPTIEELADICEVIKAIQNAYGFKTSKLKRAQAKKRIERGGFDKKIVMNLNFKKGK